MSDDAEAAACLRLSGPLDSLTVARHSGPGLRVIFWVQGCSLLCTRNCLNPHLLRGEGGWPIRPGELAGAVLTKARDYAEVEGVTVLGGEPFDQASALALALEPVRAVGLSVMVYTGHTLEELRERAAGDEGVARLLALCDILVDGPFVDELFDGSLVWRGSTNQRLLSLSGRYGEAELGRAQSLQGRAVSLMRAPDGAFAVSGAQSPESARELRLLARELGSRGPLPRSRREYE